MKDLLYSVLLVELWAIMRKIAIAVLEEDKYEKLGWNLNFKATCQLGRTKELEEEAKFCTHYRKKKMKTATDLHRISFYLLKNKSF